MRVSRRQHRYRHASSPNIYQTLHAVADIIVDFFATHPAASGGIRVLLPESLLDLASEGAAALSCCCSVSVLRAGIIVNKDLMWVFTCIWSDQ